ncbi:hypothetical protein DRO02_07275 [archaeon]|nr:MAG: hypothetical protein DRO02_07275 [archaeon]
MPDVWEYTRIENSVLDLLKPYARSIEKISAGMHYYSKWINRVILQEGSFADYVDFCAFPLVLGMPTLFISASLSFPEIDNPKALLRYAVEFRDGLFRRYDQLHTFIAKYAKVDFDSRILDFLNSRPSLIQKIVKVKCRVFIQPFIGFPSWWFYFNPGGRGFLVPVPTKESFSERAAGRYLANPSEKIIEVLLRRDFELRIKDETIIDLIAILIELCRMLREVIPLLNS